MNKFSALELCRIGSNRGRFATLGILTRQNNMFTFDDRIQVKRVFLPVNVICVACTAFTSTWMFSAALIVLIRTRLPANSLIFTIAILLSAGKPNYMRSAFLLGLDECTVP